MLGASKAGPGGILARFRGKSRSETAENYALLSLLVGALLLTLGMGLNIFSTTGLPTIMAALGALLCFASTVALVIIWAVKDFFPTDKD